MLSKDLERIEREETMRQDADWQRQLKEAAKAPATTMHAFAVAEASIDTGRYSAATGKPSVTGSTPIPQYPAAAAHQRDPVPDEPSLGFSVNDLEPSMASVSPAVEQTGAPAAEAPPSGVEPPSPDDVETSTGAPPLSKDQDNG